MCYFRYSEVREIHEDVSEDKSLYGYKVVRFNAWAAGPCFHSQVFGDKWKNGRMSTKRNRPPGITPRSTAGVYAYAGRHHTIAPLRVVKVALWGRVIEYKPTKYSRAGFRAQHAKIVAVYNVPEDYKALVKRAAPGARIYRARGD